MAKNQRVTIDNIDAAESKGNAIKGVVVADTDVIEKRIWDNYEPIGEIQKSGSIKTVVALAARDGVRYANVREFYKRKIDDKWMPGRDGITIPLLLPIGDEMIKPLAEFIPLLQQCLEQLPDFPIEDAEKAVYNVRRIER